MVSTLQAKTNKIVLSDYPFQRDVENRALMAEFSTLDVLIMEEILSGSLVTSVSKLAGSCDLSEEKLKRHLKKLSGCGLFTMQGDQIVIDKEMRKYYEAQIVKFDEDFETGVEFLKALLRKVPIEVLPNWYALPRTTSDIFQSIIDRYLLTPKIYQRYLKDLSFDDVVQKKMMEDVFSSPELQVQSHVLQKKYNLTREQFELHMISLEYHFVCCLRYTQIDDSWIEVVAPFHEWREYLLFLKNNAPQMLPSNKVAEDDCTPFSYLCSLQSFMKYLNEKPLAISIDGTRVTLKRPLPAAITRNVLKNIPSSYLKANESQAEPLFLQQMIHHLLAMNLAQVLDGELSLKSSAAQWFALSKEQQAQQLYRIAGQHFYQFPSSPALINEKNFRSIEKHLQKVAKLGWVKFDDFLKGMHYPIGQSSEVALKKVGRKWKYTLPEYTDEEKLLAKAVIFERLWELGMVDTGCYGNEDCFRVTAFGQKVFCHD